MHFNISFTFCPETWTFTKKNHYPCYGYEIFENIKQKGKDKISNETFKENYEIYIS